MPLPPLLRRIAARRTCCFGTCLVSSLDHHPLLRSSLRSAVRMCPDEGLRLMLRRFTWVHACAYMRRWLAPSKAPVYSSRKQSFDNKALRYDFKNLHVHSCCDVHNPWLLRARPDCAALVPALSGARHGPTTCSPGCARARQRARQGSRRSRQARSRAGRRHA